MKHFVYLLMEQNKNHHVVLLHVVLFFQFSMSMTVRIEFQLLFILFIFYYIGAILDIQFSTFYFPPPEGYDRILLEKSLI